MQRTLLIVCIAALLCTTALAAPAAAATWYFYDGDNINDYTTYYGSHFNEIASGDTIYVYNGSYGDLGVDKPNLTVVGEGTDCVHVGKIWLPYGSGVPFDASRTVISGFSADYLDAGTDKAYNSTIKECIFDGGTDNPVIKIEIPYTTFENNVVVNCSNSWGPVYVTINGDYSVIDNNTIINATGSRSLTLREVTNCVVSNNTFLNNAGEGIRIWKTTAANNTLTRNTFIGNNGGIRLYDAGENNRIYLNDFEDNTTEIILQGTAPSVTYWTSPATVDYTYNGTAYSKVMGNYWSDYTGTDADGDGIGDTPYALPEGLGNDTAPLMAPFGDYFGGSGGDAPVADFTADVTAGTAPLAVNFTDLSTNTPTSWAWDFGDNATSDQQNATHTYTAAGTYTVTLTATNAYGSDDEVKTDYITVTGGSGGDAPVADFSADVTSGTAPLAVNFTDLSTNAPTSWAWDFGDNATSDQQNPSHEYTATGTYTVTLTATNAYGSDDEVKTDYITVTEPAAQVDLTIAGTVNPIPASAVFAREQNPVRIMNVKNTGADAAANITVALYASDVSGGAVAINTTTIETLASGATSTAIVVDPTIRDLEGSTVTYTAVVDPDNLITETNEANNNKASAAKSVKYNGYKGKGIYWDGGSNITTKQTFDLRGGIVYAAQPDGAYKSVDWTDRTETWTADDLPVPAGATVEKALLYVAYNWDQTEAGVPNVTATFNGNVVALGTPYMDKSNFGAYADYEYGLYPAVDVTSLFVRDGNNTLVMTPNEGNKQALYPSTLAVVYSDPTATRKQIFLNEECDELAYSVTSYGTTLDEAIAYVPFSGMTIDVANVKNATLHLFAGSAGPDEGNLLFNGATVATGAWMGSANSCEALVADVTNLIAADGNEAGIQGTFSGGMCAYHQFLVVEYADSSGGDAPVADFTADVTSGTAPLAVNFTDLSTNAPTSWAWDFGDNATSTEQNATHTYTTAGTYTVILTATNAYGSDSETRTDYITVNATAQVDLTIAGIVNSVPASAVFAREPNTVKIVNVKNTGAAAAANITVALYASDVANGTVAINTTTIETLASGATSTVTVVDPTIRDLQGGTVTYTAFIDPDNLIAETNEANNNKSSAAKPLKYNGYKGKLYWEGGTNISTKRTYDLRGDLVHSFGNSSYRSGSFSATAGNWLSYAVGWTADDLPIPEGAQVVEARLYVPYTWDYGDQAPDNVSIDFNGVRVPYEYWDSDTSNFGGYADFKYGLLSYNVTGEFLKNENNTAVFTRTIGDAKISMYGFTLAVVYADPSETRKQIFLDEGFDLLGASIRDYGTTPEEATAYVEFSGMPIDLQEVANATLMTFAPSAAGWDNRPGEGALIVNGQTLEYYVWDYSGGTGGSVGEGGGSQVAVDTRDIKDYLRSDGNVVGIQGYPDSGNPCMAASQQFLVVEYADAALPDLTVSTLASNNGEVFSNSDNTYTAKITNIGTVDAGAFAVGFNVSGATGTVAVADGLAAGANTTVTWTDETVREAGETATVIVVADADGAIAEADEENNLRTVEKTVVNNGYRGKRWTGGDDLNTTMTYDVRGDLLWSAGDSAYLSSTTYPDWTEYRANWTATDLPVPGNATIAGARLYVPYTWDKGPVFPANVSLTFNGAAVEQAAAYEDEKMWGSSYPYGMTVYDVTDRFSADGNAATLTSTFPGGGNVSVRGMLLAVVYDDGTAAPHTVLINEGFDLLYGGASQGTTPEQATAYAPFNAVESGATGARLITVAPGAGPLEGDLLFNDETWTNVWNYTGTSQIGVDERDVTSFLAGENTAAFQSSGDYMEAAAAFLVVEYPLPTGSIAVTSTPAGAAVWLDGEDTGLVAPTAIADVPAGDHVVTLKLDGYADASTPVTVAEGETAVIHLGLTTLTGSLAVTSAPDGAAIFIDGAETGEVTNATLDGIAVGTHTVTVTKEGYRDATAEVTIAYNETATLHLDLVEAAGSIAVTSEPTGATIWLDGTDTGRTTNALLENVPAGDHIVTLKKDGYADASKTVTVADAEIAVTHFTLTAPAGSIAVTSAPDGARIFLDGTDTGEVTNATLTTVPVGDHTVRVSLDGYLDAEETVTVAAGATASVHFDIEASAISLVPGWNFVSTPKRLDDGQDTIAVFDSVDTAGHSVLLYNGTGRWEAMSSQAAFRPLDGIWIYANTSYTIPLAFAAGSMQTPPAKDLDEGWNAIGFSDTVPEPAVTALRSVETTWATLFGFNAAEQEYDVSIIRGATGRHGETRELAPFRGYWVYMNDADTIAAIGA
jgi:parallel beta-helix repeat protein